MTFAFKKPARILLLGLTRLILISVFLLTLAGYLGTWRWYFELASHFKAQYLCLSLCCLIIFALMRARVWLVAALLCACLSAAVIVPLYFRRSSTQIINDNGTHSLRLLLSNVNAANKNYAALLELVEREKPDIIFLQEFNAEWAKGAQSLNQSYPYFEASPFLGETGIAVYSRTPVEARVVPLGSSERAVMLIALNVGGKTLHIVSIHPLPPRNKSFAADRNNQLETIANFVHNQPAPVVVIGDFNTSIFSPYFSRFTGATGLVNARKGFGVLPTWPTQLPLLMIPIDQCLISPDIETRSIKTGRNIGSDHLPLIIDLNISQ